MEHQYVLITALVVFGNCGTVLLTGCGGGASQSSNQPPPTITMISPSSAPAGGSGFTLTINGTNFVAASVVNFGGTTRTTTFVSATQLTAAIPAAAVTSAGAVTVTVTNPTPGGGTSNAVNFTITSNPVPTITTISPTAAAAGGAAFTLTVNGGNFVSNSVVNFVGTARATAFVSSIQLTAAIPAAAIASAGTAAVTVTNPAPGGGTSNALNFPIMAPPTITTISPASAAAGGAPFFLGVFGQNLLCSWVVNFGGTARATSCFADVDGAIYLNAAIPAAAIASAGTVPVTVTNPAPGGGTSNAVNFTITSGTNPVPTISSLSSTGATPGDPAFALTVFGSNFVDSSIVQWNGSDRQTTVISSTQAEAQIPASDVAAAGTAAITVFNPAPGGGTSNALNFIIADGMHPASVAVAPDPSGKFGKFAYVANEGSHDVSMYTVDSATGALTSIGRIAAGLFPGSIAVDPSGKFVYVVNGGSNNVSMYSIDAATGALTSKGTIAAGTHPGFLAVDPSGKFAYVADPSNVSMFTINAATGALTSIGTITAGVGLFSSSVAVDPSGKFVYVTRVTDTLGVAIGAVSMYTIDATTGALTSIGSIATGIDPFSVAVDPSSRFTYVTNLESGDISMYGISTITGALTLIRTISTTFAPIKLAIHPSGKFAYVTDSNSSNIFMYTINATTGDLTSVGMIAAGASPSSSIAIDPSGKFAYVTNYESRSVSMYSIDAATGALTLMGTVGT